MLGSPRAGSCSEGQKLNPFVLNYPDIHHMALIHQFYSPEVVYKTVVCFRLCVCARECMHVCGAPWSPEQSIGSLELELQETVSHLKWCWKRNSSPLEEQQVLLATELSFQNGLYPMVEGEEQGKEGQREKGRRNRQLYI